MQSFTIQEAQNKLSTLIDNVVQGHLQIAISTDLHDAVLISKQDWDAIQETLYLNQIPDLVESIQQSSQEPLEDCIRLEDIDRDAVLLETRLLGKVGFLT